MQQVTFLWLEITGKCQLECGHCYADSGPQGTHGSMATADWRRVVQEAATAGVRMVQFVGGEPLLHPDLPELVDYARGCGLEVEVYSNLVHVGDAHWKVLSQPGVRLATSYYSDDAEEHSVITKRPTYGRTKENIAEAVRRAVPLRVGLINLKDDQRVEEARAELEAMGVTEIKVDRLRGVGRGAPDREPSMSQLCGHCGQGIAAVSGNGDVWPCVFSRWLPVGNVLENSLADILTGPGMADTMADLTEHFEQRKHATQPG